MSCMMLRLAEKQMDRLIENNISSFLKKNIVNEHYSQLELPFNGNIYKPNYEYFIDYLEEIGKYGTLEPTQKDFDYHTMIDLDNLTDDVLSNRCDASVVDLVKSAAEILLWKVYHTDIDDDAMCDYGMDSDDEEDIINGLIEYIRVTCDKNVNPKEIETLIHNEVKTMLNNYVEVNMKWEFEYDENGLLIIERGICLDDLLKKPNSFNDSLYNRTIKDNKFKQGIGLCWSYSKGHGVSYNGYGDFNVVLKGKVDPRNIDWESTIRINTIFNCEEREIRLLPNVPIEIDSITMRKTYSSEVFNLPLHNPIIVPSGVHY